MHTIYFIRLRGTDQCYVGATNNFKLRKRQHLAALKYNEHHAKKLQKAFNRHGVGSFDIRILERCSQNNRDIRELYWMKTLNSCFNTSSRVKGLHRQKEISKKRISKSLLGHFVSNRTRKKMSIANRGVKNSQCTLTLKQVIEIKKSLFKGKKAVDLAKEYGVSPPLISYIKTGRRWSHVTI